MVLITGATSGIGLSTARAYADRGAHLVLAARSAGRLATATAQCQPGGASSVLSVVTDVRRQSEVTELVDRAVAEYGVLHAVVHSVTVMGLRQAGGRSAGGFTAVVDASVNGTFFMTTAVLSTFRSQHRGTLVVVNSAARPDRRSGDGLQRHCQVGAGRSPQPPLPVDHLEKVAAAILSCIDRSRPRVSVGIVNPLILLGFRLLPTVFDALVTPLLHLASLGREPGEPSTGNVLAPDPRVKLSTGDGIGASACRS